MSIDLTRTPDYIVSDEIYKELKNIGYDGSEIPTIVKTIIWLKEKGIDTSYNEEEKKSLKALYEIQMNKINFFNLKEVRTYDKEVNKIKKGTSIIDKKKIERLIQEYKTKNKQ